MYICVGFEVLLGGGERAGVSCPSVVIGIWPNTATDPTAPTCWRSPPPPPCREWAGWGPAGTPHTLEEPAKVNRRCMDSKAAVHHFLQIEWQLSYQELQLWDKLNCYWFTLRRIYKFSKLDSTGCLVSVNLFLMMIPSINHSINCCKMVNIPCTMLTYLLCIQLLHELRARKTQFALWSLFVAPTCSKILMKVSHRNWVITASVCLTLAAFGVNAS